MFKGESIMIELPGLSLWFLISLPQSSVPCELYRAQLTKRPARRTLCSQR
jgi:hypothetical protein